MNDAYFKLFTSAYNDTYIMNTWAEKRINGTAQFANDAARAEVGIYTCNGDAFRTNFRASR